MFNVVLRERSCSVPSCHCALPSRFRGARLFSVLMLLRVRVVFLCILSLSLSDSAFSH